ncbi:MAG: TRAP transporter small permease [Synergistaceae bacterium]|nr:TRAP transporter small permease [Synergistaceae bacterium]
MKSHNKIIFGIRFLLAALITSVALLVTVQVILRYILHMPVHFLDEILALLAVWMYLLGSVNASIEEKHINARILEIFSKKIRYISGIRLLAAIISIIVSSWLTYWAYDFFWYSLKKGKLSLILKYPTIYLESAALVCFVPMVIFACVEAYKYYTIFKKNDMRGVEL